MSDIFTTLGGRPCIVTMADIYRYDGFTFEFHKYYGPCELKKNGDPKRSPATKRFWSAFEAWHKLPLKKREKYRV